VVTASCQPCPVSHSGRIAKPWRQNYASEFFENSSELSQILSGEQVGKKPEEILFSIAPHNSSFKISHDRKAELFRYVSN
jgi:hypothetical protein